jgi:DNA-binding NarL/FixJ family response regulator
MARSLRPQILPDFIRQPLQKRFVDVQLPCQAFHQGAGRRRFTIRLLHQFVDIHPQLLGQVREGAHLLGAAELKPDIIILDIYMPHLNGLDAGSQVKQKLPGVKLVFITMTMDADVAAEAFRRGASAFVLKQSAGDELVLWTISPLLSGRGLVPCFNQVDKRTEKSATCLL